MVNVEIQVTDDVLEVSADGSSRKMRVANRISLRTGKAGGRVVVGIGDRGTITTTVNDVQPAFDAARFDPDVASSATRYWSFEAVQGDGRLSMLRSWLTPVHVHLLWPDWRLIPSASRGRYVQAVSLFADLSINGRPAARSSLIRRLLGLGRAITES
jgi:hypothetical protein